MELNRKRCSIRLGVTIVARRDGIVDKIDGKRIVIKATSETDYSKSGVDIYNLQNLKDQIKILALIKNL